MGTNLVALSVLYFSKEDSEKILFLHNRRLTLVAHEEKVKVNYKVIVKLKKQKL